MSPEKQQIIDSKTGEIIVSRPAIALRPPDPKSVKKIGDVAGANPPAINLRDHPELHGMELQVVDVHFTSGDTGGKKTTYMVAAAYIVRPGAKATPDDFRIVLTGADNVMGRVMEAFSNNALPVSGILRKAGRAWFLD